MFMSCNLHPKQILIFYIIQKTFWLFKCRSVNVKNAMFNWTRTAMFVNTFVSLFWHWNPLKNTKVVWLLTLLYESVEGNVEFDTHKIHRFVKMFPSLFRHSNHRNPPKKHQSMTLSIALWIWKEMLNLTRTKFICL